MTNRELDQILKSGSIPERPTQYWEDFPRQVQQAVERRADAYVSLRHSPNKGRAGLLRLWESMAFRTSVAAGLAIACALLLIAVPLSRTAGPMFTAAQVATAAKYFREIQVLFPRQIEVIAFDSAGAQLTLSEQPTIPGSAPLLLRICTANQCRSFVTFSGQEIRFNGEDCQVLVDRQGGVMVVGTQWVWSSSAGEDKTCPYRIAARPLPTSG